MPSLSRSSAYGHVQRKARKTRAQTTKPTPEARKCERLILGVLTQHLLLPVNPPRKKRSISPPTILTRAGRKCYTQQTWKFKLPTSTVRNYTQSSSSQISINTIHLKKIKNIAYFSCSHGADVKEILLSSKNDKVSERQSFPISIHSRNSY